MTRTARAPRIAMLLIAAPLIAWLAVSLRDSWLVSDVSRLAAQPQLSRAALQHGLEQTRQARFLNPDSSSSRSWEADLEIRAGNLPAARQVYERMVRSEPKFAEAWFLLAQVTRDSDPVRAAQALAQLRRLDPLDRGAAGG